MARFTFTRKFGEAPTTDAYNSIVDDFANYINTDKLTKANLADESIRFRHLARSPAIVLHKDCSNDIWTTASGSAGLRGIGRSGSFELFDTDPSSCYLEYTCDADAPDVDLVEFTFWYYPYSISAWSEVCPAIRIASTGTWHALADYRRPAGIGVGFYTDRWQAPYNAEVGDKGNKFMLAPVGGSTFLGEADRLGTVAYGGPIICSITIPKEGIGGYTLRQIDRFGMMIKHSTSEDDIGTGAFTTRRGAKRSMCSNFDRLYLTLIARDN